MRIYQNYFFPLPRLYVLLTALFYLFSHAAFGGEKLQVIGYGVKSCNEYIAAFEGWEAGVDSEILEYLRYREWLAGLVTGLTLATGEDVLRGVSVESAMRRLHVDCDESRESDFFGSTMGLIRALSAPADGPPETGSGE